MKTIDKQIFGAVVVVLLINMIWLAKEMLPAWRPVAEQAPYAEQKRGYNTVELTGDSRLAGIYFVPRETTLAGFLDMTGVKKRGEFSAKELARTLESGDVVPVNQDGDAGSDRVKRGALSNNKRYVLDLPFNVNRATADELMLVPGIGVKTAEAIIEVRNELGGFKQIEDLLQVRGIGPKKLEKFRKYFCLTDSGP